MFDFVDNGMILARIFVNQAYYIESKNIVSGGFSANRFTTSTIAPEFGNVSAGELVFTIDKSTTCFSVLSQTEIPATINKGAVLDVWAYLESNPQTTAYIGGYIVTDVTETEGRMTATCLDKMISLDTEADLSNVTYPISAEDFIYTVFDNGGSQFFDISENVYKEVMLDDPMFEQGTTYRQVLSKVCECMGACAWATGSGEYLLVSIDFYSEVEAEIDNTKYISAAISPHGYNVRVEVTDDISALPVEITTINGETFLIMRIVANPFFANKTAQQREDIADVIMGNIGEQIWYGANITTLPMPDLLPYMIVTVDGKAVPITNITYGLNENTKIESKITTDNNTYNYSVSRDIAKVKQEVKGLEENNKHFFYRDDSGVHITMVENDYDTGNNIHIDSDSVDVRQGTDVVASFGQNISLGKYDIIGDTKLELSPGGTVLKQATGVAPGSITSEKALFEVGVIGLLSSYFTFGSRNRNSSIGNKSFASGQNVSASGLASHAEGWSTTASGESSHAEGSGGTTASGLASHAEGNNTTASGDCSHAEGNNTTASGVYSHAEGVLTIASGNYSHAQNLNTVAGDSAQTAIGKYNANNTANAFEIGNGANDNSRSNAFTVGWNGNTNIALDTTAQTGTVDGDLYNAITTLGWEGDVIA